ncbi:efflux RND transporter periplasmic adaptor subunit [Rhodoferax sp.]|uniref:efflux RND transporter periplasmic adaptor subunit n=1 Tax=Rhodoferax sp. TaxID=50421 RepID=UPI002ACEFA11|nr:efflux RND transporter periplasmic adaptor subunit [Rhodoferax sp.]MDZ7920615.1 efflux RND transporter periplasmic adaptor subunit [Rhodoferax sp.]
MASKAVYSAIAFVGIAALSGVAWWYQSKPQGPKEIVGGNAQAASGSAAASAPPRIAGVEVGKVARITLQDDAQSVGSLRSRQSVMVRPEVAGRVKTLGFKDGAQVRKGQLLVQLDDTLQRAELSQAQAQLSIAEANFKRNQELVAQNFVAQRVLDESAANVQVVQVQLALAQARLGRMAIVAPFDGTVGLRAVNVGDYVKDGADLINLEDTGSMLLDFRLPERYQRKLRPGLVVELALDAFPGRAYKARIEAVDPLLDANGRSVGIRAVLPNNGGDQAGVGAGAPLRPGMFARVTAIFGVNDAALVVPEESLVPQGGKQFVVLVVPPSEVPSAANLPANTEWVSKRQEVKLGVRRQGKVEVTEGVSEGQTIVVAGQQRLQRDGTPVRIVELGRGPAAAASAPASAPVARSSGG